MGREIVVLDKKYTTSNKKNGKNVSRSEIYIQAVNNSVKKQEINCSYLVVTNNKTLLGKFVTSYEILLLDLKNKSYLLTKSELKVIINHTITTE